MRCATLPSFDGDKPLVVVLRGGRRWCRCAASARSRSRARGNSFDFHADLLCVDGGWAGQGHHGAAGQVPLNVGRSPELD